MTNPKTAQCVNTITCNECARCIPVHTRSRDITNVETSDTEKLKSTISEFPNRTTAHGFKWTVGEDRHIILRWSWGVFIVGAVCVLLTGLYEMGTKYYDYPMTNVNKLVYVDSLPFPAVTICNLNELDYRKADHLPNVMDGAEKLFRLYQSRDIVSNVSLQDILTNSSFTDIFNVTLSTLYREVGVKAEDFLCYCSWNNVQVACAEAFILTQTFEGGCFQFNWNISQAKNVTNVGRHTGLRVIVNVQQNGYLVDNMMSAGVNVLLHAPGTFPDLQTNSKLISPGFTTALELGYKEVRHLPYPFKSYGSHFCREPSDDIISGLKYYSRGACLANCLFEGTQKTCNCSFIGQIDDSRFECTIRDLFTCIQPEIMKYKDKKFLQIQALCSTCHHSCYSTEFSSESSQAMFPSREAERILKENGVVQDTTDIRANYLELRVYYGQLVKEEVVFKPVYTWDSILGSIGGQMGLFMGASILTLCEIFECLVTVLMLYLRKKCGHPAQEVSSDHTTDQPPEE